MFIYFLNWICSSSKSIGICSATVFAHSHSLSTREIGNGGIYIGLKRGTPAEVYKRTSIGNKVEPLLPSCTHHSKELFTFSGAHSPPSLPKLRDRVRRMKLWGPMFIEKEPLKFHVATRIGHSSIAICRHRSVIETKYILMIWPLLNVFLLLVIPVDVVTNTFMNETAPSFKHHWYFVESNNVSCWNKQRNV